MATAYKAPVVIPIPQAQRESLEKRGYRPFFPIKHQFQEYFVQSLYLLEMDFTYNPETFSFLQFLKDYEVKHQEVLDKGLTNIHSAYPFIEMIQNIPHFDFDTAFRFLHRHFNGAMQRAEGRDMNLYEIFYHFEAMIPGFTLDGRPLFNMNGVYKKGSPDVLKHFYVLCEPEEHEKSYFYTIELDNVILNLFKPDYSFKVGNQPFEVYRPIDMQKTDTTLNKQHLSMFLKNEDGVLSYEFMMRSQTIHEVGKPNVYEYVTRAGKLNQSLDRKWENLRVTAIPPLRDFFRVQYTNSLSHYIPDEDYHDHPVMKYTGLAEYLDFKEVARIPGRQNIAIENYHYQVDSQNAMNSFDVNQNTVALMIKTALFQSIPVRRPFDYHFKNYAEKHLNIEERYEGRLPKHLPFFQILRHYLIQTGIHGNYAYHIHKDLKAFEPHLVDYVKRSHISTYMQERLADFETVPMFLFGHSGDYRTKNFLSVTNIANHPFSEVTSFMEYHAHNPAIEQVLKDPMLSEFGRVSVATKTPLVSPHATTSYGAFNLSKNLLRIIHQINEVRLHYKHQFEENERLEQLRQQNRNIEARRPPRGRGYVQNNLFNHPIPSLESLFTYEKYFHHSEKPSQRFFKSVHDFYEASLETGNHSLSITQVIQSCVVDFESEEGEAHVLAMHLGSYINYMRHALQYQAIALQHFYTEFNDYLSMKVKIHKSTDFDHFPRPSLRLAHDVALRDYNLIKEQVQREDFAKRVEAYSSELAFQPKKNPLVFVAPKEPEEVIDEGRNLRHCVGSYVSRISDGHTYIMFLRHKDNLDESLYTIEVSKEYQVMQTQGRKGDYADEITDAISQYRRYLVENRNEWMRNHALSYSVS